MAHDARFTDRVPPHVFFVISAVFHALGPAFAVLLFARVAVLGVMWLRIAAAATVFAIWRRPWRLAATLTPLQRRLLLALGAVLALMNSCFYEAVARLPLATVSAIEFIGPIVLAAFGARTPRNAGAFALAVAGGWLLTHARFGGEPIGYLFAFANCILFMLYIVLGHRAASNGASAGIDRLGAAMLIAAVAALPVGLREALPVFHQPLLLLAGIGVGISSSVIPYVCDQLAMSLLPRSSFALLLSLLPASSTVIGLIVLRQVPTARELAGVLLVALGVALHRAREASPLSTHADRLIGDALESKDAFQTVAYLADQIGPRPSGSKNAALAVAWTTERLRSWGLDVRNEPVTVPHWVRGAESATLVSHNDQRLVVTANGGSVATPEGGITAELVEVDSLESLDARVGGKIVLFHNPIDMDLVRAGRALEAYRRAVACRSDGANRAAAHGAIAVLNRSVGSASLRTPHTGSVVYTGQPRIPSAALTVEDALLVHRLLEGGERVRLHLDLQSEMLPEVVSANVIAEIRGRELPDEVVVIGAHLDSWDLGTGALDNGAGVAMVMEAMRLIRQAGRVPRRTIRCVLFMNEEIGMSGGRAYFAQHGHERHFAAIESDMGAAAPQGFTTTLRGDALASLVTRLAPLAALGADRLEPRETTGVDTSLLVKSGVPGFGLLPDDRHYFDFHHSPADTLDKVDPRELARCSAAITALTWILAEEA